MLRPTSVLQNMPQNSTDIFQKGLLDIYEQGPDSHEGLRLADFAANNEFSKSRGRTRQGTNSDNEAATVVVLLEKGIGRVFLGIAPQC